MDSNNKFSELSTNNLQEVEGGIPVALGVAFVAIFGAGFTAGVNMGIKKWF